jgi:hypothetical protein
MVKIVFFSISGLCHGQNSPSISAWLECVTVKNFTFSMTGMFHAPNGQFQHDWNVSWSKSSVSAWLECVRVKIVCFSMARISCRRNRKKWTVRRKEFEEEEDWYSLDQVPTTSHLVKSHFQAEEWIEVIFEKIAVFLHDESWVIIFFPKFGFQTHSVKEFL